MANRYRGLWDYFNGVHTAYEWHIPDKALEPLRRLQREALSPAKARLYHVFHDCGKPSTLQVIDGVSRFPGHVEASARLFAEACPEDTLTARLIAKDMLCHTTKPAAANDLVADFDFPTLLLTAWAELHANASVLFGGFEADSFKIKRKQLIKLNKLHGTTQGNRQPEGVA